MSERLPRPTLAIGLSRVARGDLCSGCGACAALFPGKIGIAVASPGFLRPVQLADLTAHENAIFTRVCPGLGQTVVANGRTDTILWGPYDSIQTGWANDNIVRFSGSSGGALSMILIHLLATKTVDAVVQTASAPDLTIGNATVVSHDEADILAAAGSRYAPSSPLADIAELAITGKRFAFVGKPCDAAALRAICLENREMASAFPVVLSFFCAGVPSHQGGHKVLAALGVDISQTKSFRFRGNGWPGRATAVLKDGTEKSMSYQESWGNILSKCVQHRCKICADGSGVAADIVCADAWEGDASGYPKFEEADGISLIIGRTMLGSQIIEAARAAKRIHTVPFNIEALSTIQPGQRERRRALLARLAALKLVGYPIPHYTGFRLLAAARENSFHKNLKNFLGTIRRALRRRFTE